MQPLRICIILFILFATIFGVAASHAAVPVKVSIKFILDANGNRPAAGNLHSDEQINAELDWGTMILQRNMTEFQLSVVEFTDLAGVSQHYTDNIFNDIEYAGLRNDAIANPATYHWRTDAINIYINAGTGSAASLYPPNNDYILFNQNCGNNPSCILHELGHSLNLAHTFEDDGCDDTITDYDGWTKDNVAQGNFGTTYNNLTAAQQDQVNLTYNNIMSYHVDEPQLRISPCQRDRVSNQANTDKDRLLAKTPIYVNMLSPLCNILQIGSYFFPYCQLQSALNAGGLNNGVLIMEQGAYIMTQGSINANVEMVTRSGQSSVSHGAQMWMLPVDFSTSPSPEVRKSVRTAQDEDTAERNLVRDTKAKAAKADSLAARASVEAGAEAGLKQHRANARTMMKEAEKFAAGDEKLAIQFELARRYVMEGDCAQAERYYTLVAEKTDQIYLRDEALRRARECRAEQKAPHVQSQPGMGNK